MILALCAGRTAPAELRARLAYDELAQRSVLEAERPGVGELALLCTCHRTEAYFTSAGDESEAVHGVAAILPGLLPTDQHDLEVLTGTDAIEHLFRVASGLDSLVVGEPQVLGQVRRAYALARDAGSTGPALANIFGRAIRLGRRVRSETALGRVGLSIGSIATAHLNERLGGLGGRTGAIVGSGEAAADAAAILWRQGARLSIVSRSKASAARLAENFDAPSYQLSELGAVLDKSDFAVVAVSGGIAVRPRHLPVRTREHPFVIVDLSVPRAVNVGGRADVELRSLEEIPGPRGPEVTAGFTGAQELVAEEVARIERWLETRQSGPAIARLRERAETVVADEVSRALSGLDLSDQARVRIEYRMNALGMRVANKLLHGPTTTLREADDATRGAIMRIFGLD